MLHALIEAIVLGILPRSFHLSDDVWKFILTPVALAITTAAAVLSFRRFKSEVQQCSIDGMAE
jgi:hypothetical protein